MVKSLGDLIKEALSAPVVELAGPRINGLTLGDLVCRTKDEINHENEDIQAWLSANHEYGRFNDSNYQDRCNAIMKEIEGRRGSQWIIDNCNS